MEQACDDLGVGIRPAGLRHPEVRCLVLATRLIERHRDSGYEAIPVILRCETVVFLCRGEAPQPFQEPVCGDAPLLFRELSGKQVLRARAEAILIFTLGLDRVEYLLMEGSPRSGKGREGDIHTRGDLVGDLALLIDHLDLLRPLLQEEFSGQDDLVGIPLREQGLHLHLHAGVVGEIAAPGVLPRRLAGDGIDLGEQRFDERVGAYRCDCAPVVDRRSHGRIVPGQGLEEVDQFVFGQPFEIGAQGRVRGRVCVEQP
ncbi:MAG: hypothetical protein BWX50_01616 [Euryarchaeota archaeon ADurb.Bin009]|nr:MAG: hypothetical protein BWX50_01616 [Euryarchaeota archaeon ADurb.Bin009]